MVRGPEQMLVAHEGEMREFAAAVFLIQTARLFQFCVIGIAKVRSLDREYLPNQIKANAERGRSESTSDARCGLPVTKKEKIERVVRQLLPPPEREEHEDAGSKSRVPA